MCFVYSTSKILLLLLVISYSIFKVVTVPQPHEMGSPVSVLEVDSLCPITVIQDTAWRVTVQGHV